jgi:hypothetical protein
VDGRSSRRRKSKNTGAIEAIGAIGREFSVVMGFSFQKGRGKRGSVKKW